MGQRGKSGDWLIWPKQPKLTGNLKSARRAARSACPHFFPFSNLQPMLLRTARRLANPQPLNPDGCDKLPVQGYFAL